jgi:hypothetical protein
MLAIFPLLGIGAGLFTVYYAFEGFVQMRLPLTRKKAVMGRLASVLSVATGILGVALALYCLHAARYLLADRVR